MSNTSNFRQALREAKSQALIGPNVIPKALPYLGGGLILTAVGTYGGLGVIQSYVSQHIGLWGGVTVVCR